jgi:predicted transposase YdaD
MRYVTTGERIGYERGIQEGRQEGIQEGRQEGRQEGIQEGELTLILKQLKKRYGELSPELQQRIQSLSLHQLEALGEALLDLGSMADLLDWLESQ